MMLTQNRKMKSSSTDKIMIFNFGIPALMALDGTKTCPNAGSCAKGCYARQGAFLWSPSIKAQHKRLEATKSSDFTVLIGNEIELLLKRATKQGKRLLIRVHDSGDFYNPAYQLSWYHVARAFPEVLFYAYTKQVAQSVALSSVQPINFELIYSYGGRQDHLIRETDRHSRVFETEDELSASGYINASLTDLAALGKNRRIGLVYHGAKAFKNTNWSKIATNNLTTQTKCSNLQ